VKGAAVRIACCVLLLFLAACERRTPPKPAAVQIEDLNLDRDNLLNIARGASVVSRTGELHLEHSAIHAIDGDVQTAWRSPPAGPTQTMIFSLPARARITRVGVLATPTAGELAAEVRFEASDDGTSWREITTMPLVPQRTPQHLDVTPAEATYLRVSALESRDYYSYLASIFAFGREVAPPTPPRIEGCWTINGVPARFVQRGAAVTGVIASTPPFVLSGAANERMVRLMWRRGPSWGLAIINSDPHRRTISGSQWFEAVRWDSSTHAWFGTPGPCPSTTIDETATAAAVLGRARRWMMYGLESFDTAAKLIAQAPAQTRFRVTAPDANRLGAARTALQSRGVDLTRVDFTVTPLPSKVDSEAQRVLADGLALHLQ
jgi:F5/8 type C domain